MPLDSQREVGLADSNTTVRRPAPWPAASLLAMGLASCVAYSPAPLDVSRTLLALEARRGPDRDPLDTASSETGLRHHELAAFAVAYNPGLFTLRAEIGVGQALLIEAGLLPDLEVGWDAMDVLASQIVDGTSSSVDALSGLGLMLPLLRPGERDARVGVAEWKLEETRRRIVSAEWSLTRDVYLATEEVRAAEELREQTRTLVEVAASTNDYFTRARDAGAVTGIQANLALGEFHSMRLDLARADGRVLQARQDLNGLLGLPPTYALPLSAAAEDPSSHELLRSSRDELVRSAVQRRPDLAALDARYLAAEEAVRFAVAGQFPRVWIGTGIRFEVPLFSSWGRPAIDTALAQREHAGRVLTAAVHVARQEIAATHAQWQLAEHELELVENELLPNAEESLALAQQSFQAGEITLLETIAIQSALVEARTRHTEVRAQKRKRAWALLAASGLLLEPSRDHGIEPDPEEEDSR